jgi:hypothetical protein
MSAEPTKGGAVLGLITGLARAVVTGMNAVKDVDEGCTSCPDEEEHEEPDREAPKPKFSYRRRRRRK